MNGVERSPQGVQRFLGGRHDLVFIPVGVFFQPATPCCAMRFVRFFMNGEVGQCFRLVDPVELLQPIDLG